MSPKLRHYEIVFLVHPDQSEQVPNLIQRYETLIKDNGGKIHRLEDWGKRQLAYPIKKTSRAHYVLMNIESNDKTIKELTNNFHYNDSILRNLIIKRKTAITAPSPMMVAKPEPVEIVNPLATDYPGDPMRKDIVEESI